MRASALLFLGTISFVSSLQYRGDQSLPNGRDNALFELGIQVGFAESESLADVSPELLLQRMALIKQLAREVDPTLAAEVDALIATLKHSTRSREFSTSLLLFHQKLGRTLLHGQSISPIPVEILLPADDPVKETASWEGKWETNWGTMLIVEHADGRLTGTYGPEQHSIEGQVDSNDSNVFAGVWNHSNSDLTGRFRFVMSARNSFAGAWSLGDDHPSEAGYPWTATRGLTVEVQPQGRKL